MVDVTETFPTTLPNIQQKSDSQAVPSGQDDLWVDAGDMNDLGQMVVALGRAFRATALVTGIAPATESIIDKAFRYTTIDAVTALGRVTASSPTNLNKIWSAAVETLEEGGSLSGTASNTALFGVKNGLVSRASGTFVTNRLYGITSNGDFVTHTSGALSPIAIGLDAKTAYVDLGGRFSVDNITLEFDANGVLKFIQPLVFGDTDINGTLTVSGATTLSGGLDVAGATVLSGSLRVTGAATFSGSVTMESGLTVQGIIRSDTSYNIDAVAVLNDTVLSLNETTTPTPVASRGAIYTKNNNELFFQDGAGTEHLVHGDSFSNLWFHSATVDTVAISTADTFTQIDSFENIGEEDGLANAVGDVSTDDITIGANGAGKYKMTFHISLRSATASSEFIIIIGIVLATPKIITDASNTTPIIISSSAHGLLNGDMVTIAGATGNTAANGDWIVANKTGPTFEIIDLAGADSVGNGVYGFGSADVNIVYPGNVIIHREVSSAELGAGGANADIRAAVADKIRLYVANVGSDRDLEVKAVNLEIVRMSN